MTSSRLEIARTAHTDRDVGSPVFCRKSFGQPGVVLGLAPGSSADDPQIACTFRAFRITVRRLLVIVLVIGVVDPLRDVTGHVIQAVGTAADLKGTGRSE